MKISVFIILSITIFLAFLFIISLFNFYGILDLEKKEGNKRILVGENEICSSQYVSFLCEEGLICATLSGKTKFDVNIDTGRCMRPEVLNEIKKNN